MLRRLGAFARLARPAFLAGGFAGFALGAIVARYDGYALDWRAYVLGQSLVTAFHLMVHFANDYYDRATDALTVRTPWSGGSGVLASGELPPAAALVAALSCAALGVAATVAEAARGNLLLASVGTAIGALAWAYSAPPLRLLARGLGEIDTIAVVAVLVPLAGYATFAPAIGAHALLATLPGACAMFAMMLSVEIPDIAADGATGKRNLVVRWGIRRAAAVASVSAASAVVLLVAVGVVVSGAPLVVAVAVVPVVAVAVALALAERLQHVPLVRVEFLGVALYAVTTCAACAIVGTA